MALTLEDISYISSFAAQNFVQQPARPQLESHHRELTTEEQRVVAMYEAVVSFLRQKGLLTDEVLKNVPVWRR